MNIGDRIMILGSGGSGKSTLATQLGALTNLPVIHLDRLFWNAGWVETPKDEMSAKVIAAANEDSWIIDGNYSRTLDYRIKRASCVIFLDRGRCFCICRVIRRWLRNRGRTRPDMAEGCPDKMDMEFLKFLWSFPKRGRLNIISSLAEIDSENNGGKLVLHFKKQREIDAFLAAIRSVIS